MNLERVNLLFETSSVPIEVRIVGDDEFAQARLLFRKLRERLENSNERRIEEILSGLWHIFRELYTLPIETKSNDSLQEKILEVEELGSSALKTIDSDSQSILKGVLKFVSTRRNNSSIFDNVFHGILEEGQEAALAFSSFDVDKPSLVIIRKKKYKTLIEDTLQQYGINTLVDVRVPLEMKSNLSNYYQTVIIGPLDLYENLSALLGNIVSANIVNLSHFKPSEIKMGLFENPIKRISRDIQIVRINAKSNFDVSSVKQELLSQNEARQVSIDKFDAGVQSQDGSPREDEVVPCKVMQFVDGRFVLFPAEDIERDEEKIDILIEGEEEDDRIIEVLVSDLEEDSIVLLRDGETSKSAIIPEADKILGSSAKRHRANQALWKTELRKKLNLLGRDSVDRSLRDLGIERPYSYDWSRPDLIRPLVDRNFEILLTYLGISEDQKVEIFNSSKAIKGAHVSAGRIITENLKEAFSDVNLNEIYSLGFYSKSLGGDSDVRVTALVCEGFSESNVIAPLSMTRKILENRRKIK
jgi:hypothetical protein